jgi:TolA-binding protein
MNPMYEFEDIEDYLHNRMSASDRQAFEQALATDPALAQRLEALEAESKVMRLLRNEYLLEQFADWEKEDAEKKNTDSPESTAGNTRANRSWILLVLLALLGAILAVGLWGGWFNTHTEQKPNPINFQDTLKQEAPLKKELIAKITPVVPPTTTPNPIPDKDAALYAALARETYREEDFNDVLMGAGDEEETANNYTNAVKLYSEQRYKEALKLLQLPPVKGQKEETLFLRGYTQYQLGQYAKAEQDFRASQNGGNFSRIKEASWCEVFSLVKQLPASRKRLDTAIQAILTNPKDYYYKDALKLQQDLERK